MLVENWIGGTLDNACVASIERNVTNKKDTKFTKEILQPNHFATCHAPRLGHRDNLRLRGRVVGKDEQFNIFPWLCVFLMGFRDVRLSQIPQRSKTSSISLCKPFNRHLNIQQDKISEYEQHFQYALRH